MLYQRVHRSKTDGRRHQAHPAHDGCRSLVATLDIEGEHAAGAAHLASEALQSPVESRIVHRRDPRMIGEALGQDAGRRLGALDAQLQCRQTAVQ
jgi:hypothetical protein